MAEAARAAAAATRTLVARLVASPTTASVARFAVVSALVRAVFRADNPGSDLYSMFTFWVPLLLNEHAPHAAALLAALVAKGSLPSLTSRRTREAVAAGGVAALPARTLLDAGTTLAAMAAAVPLARMLWQQATARTVCVEALDAAGVPADATRGSLGWPRAVVAAVPVARLLSGGVSCDAGVVYGRVTGRGGAVVDLRLDVYRHIPGQAALCTSTGRPAPVLLYIHGGGWVTGHRHHHSLPLLYALARAGWVVATINYRLAPRAQLRHMVHDCKRAVAWTRRHAGEYGGDANFIVVAGESAGGHLALLTALTGSVAAWQADGLGAQAPPAAGDGSPAPADELAVDSSIAAADTRVAGVVNLYGVCDWTDSGHQYLSRDAVAGGIREFVGRLVLRRRYRDHTHEFIRASPTWWLHGAQLPQVLPAVGFTLLPGTRPSRAAVATAPATVVAAVATSSVSGDGRAAESIAAAAALHADDGGAVRTVGPLPYVRLRGTVYASDVADMATDRPLPPVFTVHGTNDTLVPLDDADRFATLLAARRSRDAATAGAPRPHVADVYLRLPGAHHAFNFLPSARTFAFGDAVTDWLTALHAAWRAAAPPPTHLAARL